MTERESPRLPQRGERSDQHAPPAIGGDDPLRVEGGPVLGLWEWHDRVRRVGGDKAPRRRCNPGRPSRRGAQSRNSPVINTQRIPKYTGGQVLCRSFGGLRIVPNTPDRIRTYNLRFRRPILYPIELRVRV